nr:hypothetical protein [Tanacetum cinerariifolium]
MATTIEQQVALDEALVPSAQRLRIGQSNFQLPSDIQSKESTLQVVYDVLRRSPFFKAFLVTIDVPEIYMQEFWATAKVHQHSIRFKMDTRKHIVDLEAFREMLHISPRVPGQSFAELPFEEEILEFLRFLGHISDYLKRKFYGGYITEETSTMPFSVGKICVLSGTQESKEKQRDVVSRHQNTQQYGAILPIKLTTEDIRNTKAYKEYYACATGEAAPKPKASTRRKRGGSASFTTHPTLISTPTPLAAPRLTAAAKGKQPARATSSTEPRDEGTGSKPGVPNVPSDDSDKEISWNSSDDEDVDAQEIAKIDEPKDTESGGDDEETKSDGDSEEEKTTKKEDESFDPIPRTPEESEDDGNGEEDQGLRISEEERMHEEEEAYELYRDVDINQGGLQVSQDIEDSHVTLTPTNSDGQQKSSSTSSFVTNLLNMIIDPGMESIFTTGSSFVTPIPLPKFTMTPSIITTTTTTSQPPIPPTLIPSDVLQTLLTFASVFRFEDRVKSLEVNFSKFMRTNQSTEAVSNIPGLVHQYMHQEMMEARSDEQRNLYKALVEAYDADKTILDSNGESAILKRRREDDDDQEGPSAGLDWGSKRRREGGEYAPASTPSEPATRSAGRSTTGTQSRQMSA